MLAQRESNLEPVFLLHDGAEIGPLPVALDPTHVLVAPSARRSPPVPAHHEASHQRGALGPLSTSCSARCCGLGLRPGKRPPSWSEKCFPSCCARCATRAYSALPRPSALDLRDRMGDGAMRHDTLAEVAHRIALTTN